MADTNKEMDIQFKPFDTPIPADVNLKGVCITPMHAMNAFHQPTFAFKELYRAKPTDTIPALDSGFVETMAKTLLGKDYPPVYDAYVNRKGSEPPIRDIDRILVRLAHRRTFNTFYKTCLDWLSEIKIKENYAHPRMAVIRHLFGLCKNATHDFEVAVMLIAVTQDRLFETCDYTLTATSLEEFIQRLGYPDIVTAVAKNLDMLPTVVDRRNIPYVRKYLLCTGVEFSKLRTHSDDPVRYYSLVFALARYKQEFNRNLVTDPLLIKGGVKFKVNQNDYRDHILNALKTSSFKELDAVQIVKTVKEQVDITLQKFYYTDYNRESNELDAPGFRALNSGLELIRESVAMKNCLDDRVNEFWTTDDDWDYEDVHNLSYFHVDFEGCPKGITVSIRGPIGDADDYVVEQYHAYNNDDELLPRKSAVYAKIYNHINNVISNRNKGKCYHAR